MCVTPFTNGYTAYIKLKEGSKLKHKITTGVVLTLVISLLMTSLCFASTGMYSHAEYIEQVKKSGIDTSKMLSKFTSAEIDKMASLIGHRFNDVNDWYAKDLALLTTKGIVSGNTLERGASCNALHDVTRAEFITMLALANSTSPEDLKTMSMSAEEFVYTILGVTPKTATANQRKAVKDALRTENNISSVATEWYAKYLASLRLKSWGYVRYDKEFMSKPMTRGEVVYLLSETFLINELTNAQANKMFAVNYFKDIPSTVSLYESNNILYKINKDAYNKEIGIDNLLTTYYPKFEDIKLGNAKLPVKVKQALNIANYLGVCVGDGQNNSNWNMYVTKAETIAMIVRTLNKDSRAPQKYRAKAL